MSVFDTDCESCRHARAVAMAHAEAMKAWALNPMGPTFRQHFARILVERKLNQDGSPSDSTTETN